MTGYADDVFAQIDDHLDFARTILDQNTLDMQIRLHLNRNIDDIQQRRDDPQLYLAVVGEASTGKSTFINALLRDTLQVTSAMTQTTCAATHIQYGDVLSVDFVIDLESIAHNVHISDGETINLPWLSNAGPMNVRDLLNYITTTEHIASQVSSLIVSHPAAFLANYITLIDLPGTNVNNENHTRIARQVAEKADAAIIITDGNQLMPQSFQDFISETLVHCLHRCIFVVTKMDYVPERERERVIKTVENRIRTGLIDETPLIMAAAAQAVVEVFAAEKQVKNQAEYWVEEFANLETMLTRLTRYERTLAIAEKLISLMQQLFSPLEAPLQAQLLAHEKRWQQVQASQIQDLSKFIQEMKEWSHIQIHTAHNKARRDLVVALLDLETQTKQNTRKGIYAASDFEKLSAYVNSKVNSDLMKSQQKIESIVSSVIEHVQEAAHNSATEIDLSFIEAYQRIDISFVIGGDARQKLQFDLDVNRVAMSTRVLNTELEAKVGSNAMKAAAAGAVVGSFIPFVGTIAGAAVGGLVGWFVGRNASRGMLSDRQTQLWNVLEPQLEEAFNNARSNATDALETTVASFTKALDKAIDQHRKRYQTVVDKLHTQRKQEVAQLEQSRTEVARQIFFLQSRLDSLAEDQRTLRNQRHVNR